MSHVYNSQQKSDADQLEILISTQTAVRSRGCVLGRLVFTLAQIMEEWLREARTEEDAMMDMHQLKARAKYLEEYQALLNRSTRPPADLKARVHSVRSQVDKLGSRDIPSYW